MSKKIVIALGGNALGKVPEEQLHLLEHVAKIIVDLIKDGNKAIIITNKDEEHEVFGIQRIGEINSNAIDIK